ncbi:MAG: hypothetical protein ACI9GM_000588 [Salibacteraceae bacterium]|jgi:hypothetical protein
MNGGSEYYNESHYFYGHRFSHDKQGWSKIQYLINFKAAALKV